MPGQKTRKPIPLDRSHIRLRYVLFRPFGPYLNEQEGAACK